MAATVDRLSGCASSSSAWVSGWAKQEFEALGVPFARRGAITNDYLAAIRTLWTEDIASYAGTFVSFNVAHARARRCSWWPLLRYLLVIWERRFWSDAALRRAVRYGDGWHPNRVRTDWLRDTGLPKLARIAAAEAKPIPVLRPRTCWS